MTEERRSQLSFWVGRMSSDYGAATIAPAREMLDEIDRLRARLESALDDLHFAQTDIEVLNDALQEDIAQILRALGLGDHARSESPHDLVSSEILPAISKLTGRLKQCSYCEHWAPSLLREDTDDPICTTCEALYQMGERNKQLERENLEMQEYLIDRCKQTCVGREGYRGKLAHVSNCPAYDLDLLARLERENLEMRDALKGIVRVLRDHGEEWDWHVVVNTIKGVDRLLGRLDAEREKQ